MQYLQAYFHKMTSDPQVRRYAAACLHTVRLTKPSARRLPPSSIEIAVRQCKMEFLTVFHFVFVGCQKSITIDLSILLP